MESQNKSKRIPTFRLGTRLNCSDRASTSNPIRRLPIWSRTRSDRTSDVALPGLELDETLGADLVQDAETALPTPDGVGGLDDVAGAAIAAAVLDAAEGRDGHGGGSGGGGCWFGHAYWYIMRVSGYKQQ